jgi:hypothetical protein
MRVTGVPPGRRRIYKI